MEQIRFMPDNFTDFAQYLRHAERGQGTIENYLRHTRAFSLWLDGKPVTRENASAWKTHLLAKGYASVSVNAMISSLNALFRFLGWEDCRISFLKIQRKLFRDANRELSQTEYERLISAAHISGKQRLALLMETICATGIRVSELRFITVQAALLGRAEVALKGKIRTILIPSKLTKKLLKFAQEEKIASGEIFLTRSGKGISRRQIWAEMKALCVESHVKPSKVFPHNLRHLFATVFYKACKDIARLADVLGHSSIETTRIYLTVSGVEQYKLLNRLQLVL